MHHRHIQLIDDAVRVGRGNLAEQRKSLAVAAQTGLLVAEIRFGGVPLHHRQPLKGPGELALQIRAPGRIRGDGIEILHGAIQQQLPGGRRTRQVLDRIVNIEDQSVGKLPDIIEALLRPGLLHLRNARLLLRNARLAHDSDNGPEHDEGQQRARGNSSLVASDEFAGPVAPRALRSSDG